MTDNEEARPSDRAFSFDKPIYLWPHYGRVRSYVLLTLNQLVEGSSPPGIIRNCCTN